MLKLLDHLHFCNPVEIRSQIGRGCVGFSLGYKGGQREVHLSVQVGERWPQAEGAGGAHRDIGVDDASVVQEQVSAALENHDGLWVLQMLCTHNVGRTTTS
jgi:hypothetical protein